MKLEEYSFGLGDRFLHQGKAQLQALINARDAGVDITPVWNKSDREHKIVGTEPQSLREEAQKTLAEYKRKQRDAEAEASQMIEHAKEEARRIRQQAEKDLEAALARRTQQAEEKIQQAEATALKEVRNQAVDVAITATAKLLAEKIDKTKDEALVDRSIEDVSAKLN